jgi:DivIVA domain-containing protein
MADNEHPKQKEVPAEIRNVTFPVGVRGYDRKAVEAYVKRVNRVIAELEVTRSPQAAVRHAVERVEEQTKSVLEEARASAEKITATAQAEADEIVAQAKAHAADLVVAASTEADGARAESEERVAQAKAQADKIVREAKATAEQRRRESEEELEKLHAEAEARMKQLEADTGALWDRRHELLEDIDRMADQLHDAAREATGRFARVGAEDQWPEAEAEAEAQAEAEAGGDATETLPKEPTAKKPRRTTA